MFGTWKYNPETHEVHNIRKAFDPVTARSSQHQACDRCHEKKIKCTGEKDGCERCTTIQIACEYSRTGSKGPRRGKRSSPRSLDVARRGGALPSASVSPSATGIPSSGNSRTSRSRQPRRTGQAGSTSPMLTSQAAGEGILGQVSDPTAQRVDSYDMNFLSEDTYLSPRTVDSAASLTYSASQSDSSSSLAFTGRGSQAYPSWGTTPAYDPALTGVSNHYPSYTAISMTSNRPSAPPDFTIENTYPGLDNMSNYSYTADYSAVDPRFWPPSTQPGH